MAISVEVSELDRFIRGLFEASGLSSQHSQMVFSSMLYAEQRGMPSHGLIRIPYYLQRLEKGGINARPRIEVLKQDNACALMDGDRAMGQVAGTVAMEKAVSLAKEYNIGAVSLRRGSHFGAAGYFSAMAVEKDCIGVAISNTAANMAPTGSSEPMIGNSPVSIAIPSSGEFPLILDIALSVSSQGRLMVACERGEPIPSGLALDPNGRPTTDPAEALAGSLLPVGGYKGYGMALMADILCGVLAGGSFGTEVGSLIKGDMSKPTDKSFFFVALKVDTFCPLSEFKDRVADYVKLIKASKLASGSTEILVAGEKEWRNYQANKNEPVMMESSVYESLKEAATILGVEPC